VWYRNPTQADSLAQLALAQSREIDYTYGETEALRSLGVVQDIRGNHLEAISWYEQALEIATNSDLTASQGAILNNLGLAYWNQGNPRAATDYYLRAREILEVTGPPARLASVYNNLGLIFNDVRQLDQSLEFHQRALEIREEINDQQGIGASLHNIGSVLEENEDLAAAREYYERSITLKREINDRYGLGITLNNLGINYYKRDLYNESLEFLNEAAEIRRAIGDQQGLVASLSNIAMAYRRMEQYQNSIDLAYEALEIAQKGGYASREFRIYGNLRENYFELGDFKNAYKYTELFYSSRDSVLGEQRRKEIAELTEQFESEVKARQIENQERLLTQQELEIQRSRGLASGLGLTLVLLIAIGMIWQSRVRQRELQERVKRLEIEQGFQTERERISRDLHDNLGGQLVGMMSGLELASRYSSTGQVEKSRSVLESINEEIRVSVRQLRDAMWTLKSREVNHEDFLVHLEAHINYLRKVTDIKIDVEITNDPNFVLTPTQALNSLRIIQEALQNTIKHSGATRVEILIQLIGEFVEVQIKDNGNFKPPVNSIDSGNGLGNMRTRAADLNGTINMTTEQGTTIHVRFPMDSK
jgi:signal transduction histidine kinase